MKRSFLKRGFLLLFLSLWGTSLSAQSGSIGGESLWLMGAEDVSAGRFEAALDKFERAAGLLSGAPSQKSQLMALQMRLELGRYDGLGEDSLALFSEGMTGDVRKGALLVAIHSLIGEGEEERALELIQSHSSLLITDPSSALNLSDAYGRLEMTGEADRIRWLIKRDFPDSPEALILTGRAERRAKPSLLLVF
ncbi:MAG: hypothetical protein PQJ60_12230 [Spirochaetales bacterium]|nr:hypothetical protein [Spirochaetales bacterium]